MAQKLIIGCGYLGWRVAQQWYSEGHELCAVTRSQARADEYRRGGVAPIIADVARPETLAALPDVETILYAVGFDRSASASIQAVYAGGMKNVLAAAPPSVQRLIYISTTGVYGPAAGQWVDESTPPAPERDGGHASLAAEQLLAEHPLGRRSVILRFAGIYGPGRVPHLEKLRSGEPIAAPSKGWLNLIHVEDGARIVVAAEQWLSAQGFANGPHVFNVSDGVPVVRSDYYSEAARLIGAPAPRFAPPPPNSPAAARAAANRRICNGKMARTLGLPLRYPNYREGLADILKSGARN